MASRDLNGHRSLGKAAIVLLLTGLMLLPAAALAGSRPKIVPLPTGWQPEGIATKHEGATFFSGSIATGAIFKGNLRTGEGRVFIPGVPGRVAAGLKVAKGKLYVAGGPTGQAYVFNAHTGAELGTFQLTTAPSFINDVAVTAKAAWFTDSFNQQLYKLPIKSGGRFGAPETVPLSGDITFVPGQFNPNGIDAVRHGEWLIIVQSITGQLFKVNAHTGRAFAIDLGGDSLLTGDGILFDEHRRLWVGQNSPGDVALVHLSRNLLSGRVLSRTMDPSFDVPTTIAESGNYLAVINARFGNPSPTTASYWVTQLRKPSSHHGDDDSISGHN